MQTHKLFWFILIIYLINFDLMTIFLEWPITQNKSKQFIAKLMDKIWYVFFKSYFNFWIYISTNFEFCFYFFEFYLLFFFTFIFILFIITKFILNLKAFCFFFSLKLCSVIQKWIRCNTIEGEYLYILWERSKTLRK